MARDPELNDQPVEPSDDGLTDADDAGGRVQIVFLVLAFATVIAILIAVMATKAWDGYVCETDEDCRGIKVCREGQCVSSEIWQRQHFEGASTAE